MSSLYLSTQALRKSDMSYSIPRTLTPVWESPLEHVVSATKEQVRRMRIIGLNVTAYEGPTLLEVLGWSGQLKVIDVHNEI